MTPDERNMLTDLANKIAQTPAPPRDPDAEDLIRSKIGNRPDALYLMTQTVLIQNMALQQAQKQIQDLQQNRGSNTGNSGSFLGQSSAPPTWQSQSQPQYAQQPSQYAQPAPVAAPSGAPSFLRGAAQTAAGVAAGALAFEGIQSLFSHPGYGMGGGSGFGGFGGGGFGGQPMEETVVNNYYDSPSGSGGGNDNLRLGDNRDNFADSGSGTTDSSYSDDTSLDDSSNDNSSSGGFDDSGSDFS